MNTLNLKINPKNKILLYENDYAFYSLSKYSFHTKKNYIRLLSDFISCKESLIYCYSEHIKKDYFSNLKLIVNFYTASYEDLKIKEEKMNQAVKIINMFGNINNWPVVKVYKVKLKHKTKIFFLFDLPYKWFKFPQLLSLVTLIIDSCHVYHIKKNNTIKNFIKLIKNNGNNNDSSIFFKPIDWINNIPLIINNYDYIFKNETTDYNYNYQDCLTSAYYSFTKYSGIKSLCSLNALNTSLNTKLKQLIGEK